MSKKIIPAAMTEGPKQAASRALTDNELNVVAGGARNLENPCVRTALEAAGFVVGKNFVGGPATITG
jgi:hypothetical protein